MTDERKYEINWAGPARLDLMEIAQYIAEDSPETARRVAKRIREKVNSLYVAPERGRIVPELSHHGIKRYREIIVSPWRIVYEVQSNRAHILFVVDGRRNLEDLLFKRLLR